MISAVYEVNVGWLWDVRWYWAVDADRSFVDVGLNVGIDSDESFTVYIVEDELVG